MPEILSVPVVKPTIVSGAACEETTAPVAFAEYTKVSSPSPPVKESAPWPPVKVSLPAPPSNESLPVPPVIESAPAPVVKEKPAGSVEVSELVTTPPTPEALMVLSSTPPPVMVIGAVPALLTVIVANVELEAPTERAETSAVDCRLLIVTVSMPVADKERAVKEPVEVDEPKFTVSASVAAVQPATFATVGEPPNVLFTVAPVATEATEAPAVASEKVTVDKTLVAGKMPTTAPAETVMASKFLIFAPVVAVMATPVFNVSVPAPPSMVCKAPMEVMRTVSLPSPMFTSAAAAEPPLNAKVMSCGPASEVIVALLAAVAANVPTFKRAAVAPVTLTVESTSPEIVTDVETPPVPPAEEPEAEPEVTIFKVSMPFAVIVAVPVVPEPFKLMVIASAEPAVAAAAMPTFRSELEPVKLTVGMAFRPVTTTPAVEPLLVRLVTPVKPDVSIVAIAPVFVIDKFSMLATVTPVP